MKLSDVSTPGKRRKRVLNVPGSGWMAVVRRTFTEARAVCCTRMCGQTKAYGKESVTT